MQVSDWEVVATTDPRPADGLHRTMSQRPFVHRSVRQDGQSMPDSSSLAVPTEPWGASNVPEP